MVTSCTFSHIDIQNGDLLFCAYEGGNLSDAISEVTQTQKATNYAHMGIVEITTTDTFVWHASPKLGVAKQSLKDFLSEENASQVDIYRLQNISAESIQSAFQHARQYVGLPYNSTYILTDTAFYCSQFIYRIFEQDSLFQLEPMTFKNPATEKFHPDWIRHYSKLGIDIPEGKLGCNPNGMAASNHLQFVTTLPILAPKQQSVR